MKRIGFYENIYFTEQNQTLSDYFSYIDTVENSINTINSEVMLVTKNYDIHLFPNPAQNYLTITNTNDKQNSLQTFEIINVIGEQVYKGEFSNNLRIQLHNLNSGLYFIKFSNGEILKFIKKD